MPRFTSNKQIIKSSPELLRGVQDLSNSLVAKEQITAIQNQRDIQNFESLVDISTQGILAADQNEILSSVTKFKEDTIKKGLDSDGNISIMDMQAIKQRKGELETNVALSQQHMKDTRDIIKMIGKDKTGSFDLPATEAAFAKWGNQPIGDRADPWSLVKLNPSFTIPEYLDDHIKTNVKEGFTNVPGGTQSFEKFESTPQMAALYKSDPKFSKVVDDSFEVAKKAAVAQGEEFNYDSAEE